MHLALQCAAYDPFLSDRDRDNMQTLLKARPDNSKFQVCCWVSVPIYRCAPYCCPRLVALWQAPNAAILVPLSLKKPLHWQRHRRSPLWL